MPPRHHRGTIRRRAPVTFLALAVLLTLLIYHFFKSLGSIDTQLGHHNNSPAAAAQLGDSSAYSSLSFGVPYLGFPYPQLAKTRSLVASVCCHQQRSWTELSAAYGAALATLAHGTGAPNSRAAATKLHTFLDEAFTMLAAEPGVLQCHEDPTLLAAWSQSNTTTAAAATKQRGAGRSIGLGTPNGEPLTAAAALAAAASAQPVTARHYLLAANFHNSAAVLPNFIVQTLYLSLLLPPGHLAVSLYESGSSDTSRMWLTLLHQLLLPLGVPHNITTAGQLSHRSGLPRIALLAALRNALLEPWMTQQQQQQERPRLALRGVSGRQATAGSRAAAAAGAAELAYAVSGFVPDTVVFANDVLLCAGDVLRLVMHDAHIACGLDFYTAAWQEEQVTAAAAAAEEQATPPAGDGEGVTQQARDTTATATAAAATTAPAATGTIHDDDDDDDFFDPDSHQLQPTSPPGPAGPVSTTTGGIRFYDKWVARDVGGHRLVNRPPFITHHQHSAAQLAAGQPVAATCCWNGLAVLAAAPFRLGLRFRPGRPGECQASEASLVCEDFARLGLGHVVMDPGVRLAYEVRQVDMLGGAAATSRRAQGSKSGSSSSSSGDSVQAESREAAGFGGGGALPVAPSLGPRLSWSQVATSSAHLAAAAKRQAAAVSACKQQQKLGTGAAGVTSCDNARVKLVECCDLQPGHSYVNFRRDCHMVDIMLHNYTADALLSPEVNL